MRIGYSVEGSTDRALLRGLRDRWCPGAELIEGRFRGTTRESARREIRANCVEFREKGASIMVFLRDANREEWRAVLRADEARCADAFRPAAVFAVCDRNVEGWLAADPDHIARQFKRDRNEFALDDPKGIVESVFGITRTDKKEEEIAAFVRHAPLRHWLANPSFDDFYRRVWQLGKQFPHCAVENLLEAP